MSHSERGTHWVKHFAPLFVLWKCCTPTQFYCLQNGKQSLDWKVFKNQKQKKRPLLLARSVYQCWDHWYSSQSWQWQNILVGLTSIPFSFFFWEQEHFSAIGFGNLVWCNAFLWIYIFIIIEANVYSAQLVKIQNLHWHVVYWIFLESMLFP